MELFDNNIKQQIDQLESPVATDMWERIESQLDKADQTDKVRPVLFWSLGLILLMGMIVGYFYFLSPNTNIIEKNDSLNNTENTSNAFSMYSKEKENTVSLNMTESTNGKKLSSNKQAVFSDIKSRSKKGVQLNTIVENQVSTKGGYLKDRNTQGSESAIASTKVSADGNKPSRSLSSNLLSHQISTQNRTLISAIYPSINTTSNIDRVPKESAQLAAVVLKQERTFETPVFHRTYARSYLEAIPRIEPFDLGVVSSESSESNVISPHIIKDPDCPDLRENVNEHFLFEFHVNPLYNRSVLTSKSNEYDDYPQMREKTESNQFSYNLGFRTGFKNEKGYMFSTGLDFTQLNTKFNHIDSAASKKTTIIDTIFYEDGTFDVNVKTITVYGSNAIKAYNYMTMLDIPLLFSYEMPLSSRSSVNITAGAFLNLSFSHEARIVNPEDVPKWVSSSSKDDYNVYKDGLGISFYFAAGYNYKLTPKWHVLFMPNVRFYSENFTIGAYPLSESHQLFGLRTGIRYLF